MIDTGWKDNERRIVVRPGSDVVLYASDSRWSIRLRGIHTGTESGYRRNRADAEDALRTLCRDILATLGES